MARRNEKRLREVAEETRLAHEKSRVRLFGVILICAYAALVPVVFDPAADAPFPIVKGLLAHSLAYALAGALAAYVIAYGRRGWVWSWMHVPVLAFLAANLIAAIFAPDLFVALFGTHIRMLGLGTVAGYVVLYLGIALLVRTRREAIAIVASGVAGSAAVLGYEAIQFVGKDPVGWSVSSAFRPFSTLGQTTILAEYLTVLLIGAVAIALLDERLALVFRLGVGLYSLLLAAGILLTQTRSALTGLMSGAAVLLVLTWHGHPSRRARMLSLAGAGATTVALAVVLLFTPLGARLLSTVDLPGSDVTGDDATTRLEGSAEVRVALYDIAIQMVRDRPLFGYGPDNFSVALPRYRSEAEPFEVQQSPATSAHGWAAQLAATSGLVGLAAFVAIPITAFVLALRSRFQPGAWAAIGMLAAFVGASLTTISDLGVDWLFWAAAGGVAAATARPVESPAPLPTPRRKGQVQSGGAARSKTLLALSALAIGVVMASTSAVAFGASRSAKDSQLQRQNARPQPAIEAGNRAVAWDGRRPEYWDTLGLAYVSADRFRDAASAFERAHELAPYDVRYSGDAARAYVVLFQRGDRSVGARATELGEIAVKVDPNNPLANHTRAVVMQVTGNLPEAVRSVERSLALDQTNSPAIFLTATQVYLASGRPKDAIATARSAIGKIGPPNTVPIRVELARALVADGQSAAAVAELDAALAIKPNDPAALQLRSQIIAGLRS